MARYLFVLLPLLAVVLGGWLVTSALEHPTAAPPTKGQTQKPSTTRRTEPYRSPLPIVDPLTAASTEASARISAVPPNESAGDAPSEPRWTAAQQRGARNEAFALEGRPALSPAPTASFRGVSWPPSIDCTGGPTLSTAR